MTRKEAIAIITEALPSLDDDGLAVVAEIVTSLGGDQPPLRPLSARELALLKQSQDDFNAGHAYSHDEVAAMVGSHLASRRARRSSA